LTEYGAQYPGFIEGLAGAKDVPYLGDTARLEWALHAAWNAPEHRPLTAGTLARQLARAPLALWVCMAPCVRYVESEWPVDLIWDANQRTDVPILRLESQRVFLEVRRIDDRVAFRRISEADFSLRRCLAEGGSLQQACETAVAAAGTGWDLSAGLADLLSAGIIRGVRHGNKITRSLYRRSSGKRILPHADGA
jgi:hypothetical protein